MTIALCLKCGETKWGAWCECEKCGEKPDVGSPLELIFTDHNYAPDTLEQLGAVLKEISSLSADSQQAQAAFLYYLSVHHPTILQVNCPPEEAKVFDALLAACTFEPVTIEQSFEALMEGKRVEDEGDP
jgi:hypothetical protein